MIEVSTATRAEAALFGEWALREEWGPGVEDVAAFYAADPDGFLIARRDGVPVGCISAVRYDDSYFFVGFYIVDPALRGQGIGHVLFDGALARIGGATSGLDGVAAQVGTYESLGYQIAGVTARYGGNSSVIAATLAGQPAKRDGFAGPTAGKPAKRDGFAGSTAGHMGHTRPVQPDDLDALIEFDTQCVPAPRESFVRSWLTAPRDSFLVERDGEIAGYACVRPVVGGGARIGPLFADALPTARALLGACAAAALPWGDPIFLDIPDANAAAVALAESLGMTAGFSCTRMYRGSVPVLPLDRIWGSTSFELG